MQSDHGAELTMKNMNKSDHCTSSVGISNIGVKSFNYAEKYKKILVIHQAIGVMI